MVYTGTNMVVVLNVAGRFGKCLMGMNYALGDVPVTVKMRTGVRDNAPTAHKLMPRLHDWGVSSVAVRPLIFQPRIPICVVRIYTKPFLASWEDPPTTLHQTR
jgi:tRNA-dihydrouridine synthase 3